MIKKEMEMLDGHRPRFSYSGLSDQPSFYWPIGFATSAYSWFEDLFMVSGHTVYSMAFNLLICFNTVNSLKRRGKSLFGAYIIEIIKRNEKVKRKRQLGNEKRII